MLLPWLIEWVTIQGHSCHRGMRHTAAKVAMHIMPTLCTLKQETLKQKESKARLQAGKKAKNALGASLAKEVETLETRAARLGELAHTIFDSTFLHA